MVNFVAPGLYGKIRADTLSLSLVTSDVLNSVLWRLVKLGARRWVARRGACVAAGPMHGIQLPAIDACKCIALYGGLCAPGVLCGGAWLAGRTVEGKDGPAPRLNQ